MRTIKFKAKRVDNGEWVVGDLLHDFWAGSSGIYPCAIRYKTNGLYSWPIEVYPETVCQFTGLTDKNGAEIWEGDEFRVIGTMSDAKYSFDCVFMVNRINHNGISLYALRLTSELPDSIDNSHPIHQSPSFNYRSLCVRQDDNQNDNLCFDNTWGENTMSRTRWKEHDFTDNVEVIGNIHDK